MRKERLPLFRNEALESVRPKALGEIVLVRPLSLSVLTFAATLVAAAIVVFLICGNYTQEVSLRGQLAPRAGVIGVYAPLTGKIVEQTVFDGDDIAAGQTLYVVAPVRSDASASLASGAGARPREMVVNAPVDGTVASAIGQIGQTIDGEQLLMTIVPDDSELEARLLAPSGSIGLIRPGMEVMLRYDAYPYQRFGHYRGTLRSVSRVPVATSELAAERNKAGEPLYLIRVALSAQSVIAFGEPHRLRPGMTVQAVVPQGTRRFYEWILEPLRSLAAKQQLGNQPSSADTE